MKQLVIAVVMSLMMLSAAQAYQLDVITGPAVDQVGNESDFLANISETNDLTKALAESHLLYQGAFVLSSTMGNTGTTMVSWAADILGQAAAIGIDPHSLIEYEISITHGSETVLELEGANGGTYEVWGYDFNGDEFGARTVNYGLGESGTIELELGLEYNIAIYFDVLSWALPWVEEGAEPGDTIQMPPDCNTEIDPEYYFTLTYGDEIPALTTVPEPSTFVLAFLGLAGLVVFRKRFC